MLKYRTMLLATAVFAGITVPVAAQPANGTKTGVLSCRTSASLGLIVGSHQKLACSFTPDNGGSPERYVGHINRLGLDLGVRAGGALAWAVVAPTTGYHHGALAGKYVGASGSVSVGLGAGAHVLVGGSHRSFALQPLSVEGQAGVNLALGVAGLTLYSAH
jgi:Protein of unknown function (DUF992)